MHSVQTTQLLALSNQLHDAQGTANDLRSQLLQADHSRNDAERCANCAELELQMERMWAALSMSIWSPKYHGCRDRYHRCGHEHHVHCCITHYRGGGESTTFITPSDEENISQNTQPRVYNTQPLIHLNLLLLHSSYYPATFQPLPLDYPWLYSSLFCRYSGCNILLYTPCHHRWSDWN